MKRFWLALAVLFVLVPATRAADPAVNVLIDAIRERRVDVVSTMLLANPQLASGVDVMGVSVLHYAAGCGDKRILQSVLGARPNVNVLDRQGRTPIFRACEETHGDNLNLLLAHQANPNVADGNGMTPLLIVCEKGKPDMARSLLAAGARVDAVNKDGTGALMYAGLRGNPKLATILLGAGAKANAVDAQGNTALHYAARSGERDMIKLFPTLINVKNAAGQTPLSIAAIAGHTKFVQELAKFGATN
ncbi:MAG: ankyrin repeat domain-containing protein [Planctomycetes bacterium]|nr:ankyrin repeat domain-containing protein [Planctomycetota bacterium]